jgi:hypothetical protein
MDTCRYPQDTVHDVATKELEYVQGHGDTFDENDVSRARRASSPKGGGKLGSNELKNAKQSQRREP